MNTIARQILINQISQLVQQNPEVFKKVDSGDKGYLTLGEFLALVRQVSNSAPDIILDTYRELESKYRKVGLEAITGSQVHAPSQSKTTQPSQPPQNIIAKAADKLAKLDKTIRDVFSTYDSNGSNLWGKNELNLFLRDYVGNVQPEELESVLILLNKYRIQPFQISAFSLQQFFPSAPQQPAQTNNNNVQSIVTQPQVPQLQQQQKSAIPPSRQTVLTQKVPDDLKQWLPLLSPHIDGEEPYHIDSNLPGLKEFIDIFSQLKQQGGKYSDIDFAPSNVSQGPTESRTLYKWERPQIFFKDDFDVFEQTQGPNRRGLGAFIDPDDIQQGALGDCYFLSTLSSISYLYPEAIVNLFITRKSNDFGIYSVQLCLEGTWKVVTIDDQFPSQNGKPAFTRSDAKELWVMILEKAWAKSYKSYANIEAGLGNVREVMRAILGCPTLSLRTDDKEFDCKIEQYCSSKYVMVSGTRSDLTEQDEKILGIRFLKFSGLVKGHAYSLLGVVGVKHPQKGDIKLVQLRNPWGQTEWTGDWSDSSALWTPTLKEIVGIKDKNDGDFFMDIRDYKKQFTSVDIGFYNPGFRYSSVQVQSYKKRGLYFKFEIVKEGQYFISAVQDSERHFRNQYQNYKYSPIRIMLAKQDQDNYVLIGSSTTADRESWTGGNLTPGKYVLHVKASWLFWSDYNLVISSYGIDEIGFVQTDKNHELIPKILAVKALNTPEKTKQYSNNEGKVEMVEAYDIKTGYNLINSFRFGYFAFINSTKTAVLTFNVNFNQMAGLKLRKPQRGNAFSVEVKPGATVCVVLTVSPTGFSVARGIGGSVKSLK